MKATDREVANKVRAFMYNNADKFELEDRCAIWDLLIRFEDIEHFGASNLSLMYYDDLYISIEEVASLSDAFKKLTKRDLIALPKEVDFLLEVEDNKLNELKLFLEKELERRKFYRENKTNQSELPSQLAK